MSAGKGSAPRPVDAKTYGANYNAIFRGFEKTVEPEGWECPTCRQQWMAETDYDCGCCGRPASEHLRVTTLCRQLKEAQAKIASLTEQLNALSK